ncbi:LOW QUALITY PROTEIN: hypothetical protein MXB_4209 [Myxobolus squamalis]|nr:LOW QUALITY PROTEIN: hypothetical protein MXB_4209 [Myxobolus squamalis]
MFLSVCVIWLISASIIKFICTEIFSETGVKFCGWRIDIQYTFINKLASLIHPIFKPILKFYLTIGSIFVPIIFIYSFLLYLMIFFISDGNQMSCTCEFYNNFYVVDSILNLKHFLKNLSVGYYLYGMSLVMLSEIIHEMGHVLAGFSEGINTHAISHTIYIGFIPFSKTHYDLESTELKSQMSCMRLLTGGVTNNLFIILVAMQLQTLIRYTPILNFLRILLLTRFLHFQILFHFPIKMAVTFSTYFFIILELSLNVIVLIF